MKRRVECRLGGISTLWLVVPIFRHTDRRKRCKSLFVSRLGNLSAERCYFSFPRLESFMPKRNTDIACVLFPVGGGGRQLFGKQI